MYLEAKTRSLTGFSQLKVPKRPTMGGSREFSKFPKNGFWGVPGAKTGPQGVKKPGQLGGGVFGNLSGFTVENNRIRGAKKRPNLGPRGSKKGANLGPRIGGSFRKFIRVCNGKQQDQVGKKEARFGAQEGQKMGKSGPEPGVRNVIQTQGNHHGQIQEISVFGRNQDLQHASRKLLAIIVEPGLKIDNSDSRRTSQ